MNPNATVYLLNAYGKPPNASRQLPVTGERHPLIPGLGKKTAAGTRRTDGLFGAPHDRGARGRTFWGT